MFQIKTGASEPIQCATIAELQDSLKGLRDQHVSIAWSTKSGVTRVTHVSVDSNGGVFDSYGAEGSFDFLSLPKGAYD